MAGKKMMKNYIGLFGLCSLFAFSASAYDLRPGDWLIRGVTGASINVVREDTVTTTTPGAGAILGVEAEYMFDNFWAVTGAIRPVVAPGFVDLGFGIGAKYRWTSVVAPFIPYASIAITPAVLIPTDIGGAHFNLGLRPTIGCDYFVMRDLAMGFEVAMEPSALFGAIRRFELSIDIMFGIAWRI